MNNFEELGLLPPFVEKLAEKKITEPTAVQRLAIPPLLEGKSIIFRSATGTGKTFAYLLPALQRMSSSIAALGDSAFGAPGHGPYRGPALVVCAPTAELCSQIKTEADFLLAGTEIGARCPSCALLTGSGNTSRQVDSLKKNKPLIAVGNPGRLLLLAKMGKLKLGGVKFLVLDEADRLTASDCREETAALIQIIAGYRKAAASETLTVAACSATVTDKTRECLRPLFGDGDMTEAMLPLLETDEQEILRDRIEHWAIFSESRQKTQTLISFLAAAKPKKILVFTGRSHDAGKIVAMLQKRGGAAKGSGMAAAGLYSGMDKQERKNAIDRFRTGKCAVLVSSDLAARGLDIPGITHVAALDVSENKDAYIHRAGRTGRAGKRGIMVSIGDEVEMRRLAALEKKLGIKINPKELFGGRIRVPESIS